LKVAIKSLFAPFLGVTFPVIWMTDQLVSLITPFKDFAYTICYFIGLTSNTTDGSAKSCNSNGRI
jgi:hypothetical protein